MRLVPHRWLVLTGNRLLLAGLLTSAFGVGVLALMLSGAVSVRNTMRMMYLFQVLVAGNLTLLTIVLSINQLVLSREFNTPGELRDQIRNVLTYRDSVEETADRSTMPVTPSNFLFALLDGMQSTARRLGEDARAEERSRVADEVDTLCSELTADVDRIEDVSPNSESRIFNALVDSLETNYSHQLNEAHRIQTVYADELSSTVSDELDELIQSLEQVDIARQYFKSIYMQSELARLSRVLLYVGVPAATSSLLLLFIYAGAPGTPVTIDNLELFVPVVVVLGFSPLAVLSAYVLRIAVVAQRTVAITPFVTPNEESERPGGDSGGDEQ